MERLTNVAYWLCLHTWSWFLMRVLSKLTAHGLQNVPAAGPLILVSNHLNNADPPVITNTIPRRIYWMAKKELFDNPVLGLGFRFFGYISVRRFEADLGALRKSQETLARGHVLGMFPEGTRSKTGGLKEAEPGTAVIALRTGAPILPVAIWGTENFTLPRDLFRRTRVEVRVGEPFQLTRTGRLSKEQVADGTREIMERIAALLPEDRRGIYRTSQQPQPSAAASE
jgi:1-acyl-sn-glycerol-3-phosphate acyltransferase